MKIVTRHNRSTVTFVKEIHPGGSRAPGVMLDILGSDSDDDDMYAYAWLNMEEVMKLANGLLQMQDKQYIPFHHSSRELVRGSIVDGHNEGL